MNESAFLHFSEHTLQEVALVFMACVYALRLRWLFKFKAGKDRQPPTGDPSTNPERGAKYSLSMIALPTAMEGYRNKPWMYVQFVAFHIAVVAAIGLSFVIPYLPGLLEVPLVVFIIRVCVAAGFLVGLARMYRRVSDAVMRKISSPDDYFSLTLLTVWFAFAWAAAPNDLSGGEGVLLAFFITTAFFLIYVPFSKISHYLYYPFTRLYLGRTLGHRGVYPMGGKS